MKVISNGFTLYFFLRKKWFHFIYALVFGLQVKVSQRFGGPYWNATLMNMMGTVVAVLVALCWDMDLKEWRLGWNIRLLTIAYAVNINPSNH